jgi:hypothetical protein
VPFPPALPTGAQALGGGMSLGSVQASEPLPPMNIGAGYRNIYGTDINASFDPVYGTVRGSATIPVGDARNGFYFEASGGYNTGTRQPEGFIGVRKRNLSKDKGIAEQQMGLTDPNRDAYSYGIHLNKPQSPSMGMPFMGMPSMGMPPGGLQMQPYQMIGR